MSLYTYKAVAADGRKVQGRIDAPNLIDLEMRLKRIELDLISGELISNRHLFGAGGVPRRELIHFCFHLELLVRAGVPILEGLSDLRDSLEHPRFREVVASLVEAIDGGRKLSQAMESQSKVFDQVFVSLIRAGETTAADCPRCCRASVPPSNGKTNSHRKPRNLRSIRPSSAASCSARRSS